MANLMFDDNYRFAREQILPSQLTDAQRYAIAIDAIGHCLEELIELRKEIPRKSWKDEPSLQPIGGVDALSEIADVLLFLDVVRYYLGFSSEDVATAVAEKRVVNDSVRTDHHKRVLELAQLGNKRY